MSAATNVVRIRLPAGVHAVARARARWLPLAVILVAQTWLTARLINHIPSSDEGRYVYAGHQLIYELFHGGGSPYYETYFSGAPAIYPPLAAAADHLGGIIAVRLMSTVFMLVTTTMLYLTTRRLFGYGAGIAAAGLFAAVGLTHSIGVYANYDAMALMLISVAGCFAAQAADPDAPARWLLAVPLMLAFANATKYPSLLFDPVVIAIAAVRLRGWRAISRRMAILGLATGAFLAGAAFLAGTAYIKGILFTTLNRPKGNNAILGASYVPVHSIVAESWGWIGVVIAVAVLSLAAPRRDIAPRWFLAAMVFTGTLVTLEAIHLHSDESMGQHDDFGVWFACIAAGYALSVIPQIARQRAVKYSAAMAAAAVIAGTGVYYAVTAHVIDRASVTQINHSLKMDAIGHRYLMLKGGRYLISGGFAQMIYTDHVNLPWWNLADDNYFKYPIPGRGGDSHGQSPGRVCQTVKPGCVYLEGPHAYAVAIQAHWFDFISLYGRAQAIPQDSIIQRTVEHTPGYVLLTRLGNAPTWIYAPAYRTHPHVAALVRQPAYSAGTRGPGRSA